MSIVLVTGARSGIGRQTTLEALRQGHTVYAGLRDVSTADDELASSPARLVQLDVTDPEQRFAAVSKILAEEGRIDGLVNNAGIGLGGFLETLDEDEIRSLFEVNFFAVWALTRAVVPSMRKQGSGHVVMVSSMSGRFAWPGLGAYASSKFALEGMSEAWRQELLPFGIQLYLVEPGPYKTDILSRNRRVSRNLGNPDGPYAERERSLERLAEEHGAKRAGDPQEVATLITQLLTSQQSRLRFPIGPWVTARTAAFRMLPHWVIERILQRIQRP